MPAPQYEKLNFTEKHSAQMLAQSHAFYRDISERRSVRDFSNRPVPRAIIENALLAAGTAPSGANQQPWHFVAISNPVLKGEIRQAAEEEERAFYNHRATPEWLEAIAPFGLDEHKPFLEIASYLIVIFAQKAITDDEGQQHKTYYSTESVGIATGMLITALHLAGLVTLTHTPNPMRFLNQLLDRPDSDRPFLILVAGYPSEEAQVPVIKKHPLERFATFIEA